jgi:hypothetical protein
MPFFLLAFGFGFGFGGRKGKSADPGPDGADGILLETGVDFLQLENGDYFILN